MDVVQVDGDESEDKSASKFSVDISAIESIQKENQELELQSLELDVFDQRAFERGVIEQVGKALTGDAEHFFIDDQINEPEEGELTKNENEVNSSDEKDIPVPKVYNKSSKNSQDPLRKIEEYLKTQAKLQENRTTNFLATKKKKNEKDREIAVKGKKVDKDKARKDVYLGPSKKKCKKEKLGTKKGWCQRQEEPQLQPGEENYFSNVEDNSGSEYIPSDETVSSKDFKTTPKKRKAVSVKKSRRKHTDLYILKSDSSDLETQSSHVKIKKKSSDTLDTDDSAWESEEEEEYLPKKRGNREPDDGDSEIFSQRMKKYNKNKAVFAGIPVEDYFVVPRDIWEKLYEYQKKACAWLWGLNQQRCGGILGDEMGLGKTIQLIAFFAGLHRSELTDHYTRYKGLGPSLIVCPTTVMHQWVREFHKWYPQVRVVILHESGTYTGKDRTRLIKSIHSDPWGVLVTSYSGLVQYQDSISSQRWHYVILDEGHKIRNHKAKVTLAAKQIDTPNRIILSGSPLQNHLQELWSLFDFVFPGKLGDLPTFVETFVVPIMQGGYTNASQTQVVTAHRCATVLKDTITPYLLRRMKEDVSDLIKLPAKKEQVLFCRLTDEQRELYKSYIENIDLDEMVRGRTKIFVACINLRKICNHPDLYSGGPHRNFKLSKQDEPPSENHFGYWEKAGKMIVIQTLLKIWKQQGHRVLLFTQSRKMLLIMEDFVKRLKYKYLKLDGGTCVGSRQPLIDKFNQDTSYYVMLLTTRVGGLGVNLTGANRVVIYDPDWNPATDTQARERAWRIGQLRDVTVYRLITAGTIEEKIYHRQIFKQFLSNKVLKDPKQRRFFKSNDLLELFTLTETIKNGTTETAAIFAGTGSVVKLPKLKESKIETKSQEQITFSPSKIDKMKKLAQLLNKKMFEKSLTVTSNNNFQKIEAEPIQEALESPCKKIEEINESPNDASSIYGADGELHMGTAIEVINSVKLAEVNTDTLSEIVTKCPESVMNDCPKDTSKIGNTANNVVEHMKPVQTYKNKKRKKSKEKFATFEGKEIPHLVKKRKFKKDKDKGKVHHLSQDDYVLKKLFSKGIETALRHDTIMEGGPSDFAIVEAEADRVAQEALKTLKQSQNSTPPRFRRPFNNKSEDPNSLLAIIKKRNMLLDAGKSDVSLLSEMITWLQSQGGTASTNEILNEFRPKVGEGKSPLFKSLLEKIAKFYRGPDKMGYWTIKEEYVPSTSQTV